MYVLNNIRCFKIKLNWLYRNVLGEKWKNIFKRIYFRETIKIRYVFIWIIFLVFLIIEVYIKLIKL